mmetsp:Transcript_10675/g.35488  ORF Transcript_10675/g.35488 Transcript_10675/m.35488 type:complete len:100 (-) Transcript_10675:435-734(-)
MQMRDRWCMDALDGLARLCACTACFAPPLSTRHKFMLSSGSAHVLASQVDDDADGCVDWEELRDMFHRIRRDQSGFEPRKLFNLVEFIMHDKNANGAAT